jgi:hypothetical protein
VVAYFTNGAIAELLATSAREYAVFRALLYAFSFLAVFFGVGMIWMRLTKVEVFFDYSARMLREIYIRSQSVQDLVRVNNILRDSLDSFGLIRWKEKAEVRLWDEFHRMLGPPPQHVIDTVTRRNKGDYALRD